MNSDLQAQRWCPARAVGDKRLQKVLEQAGPLAGSATTTRETPMKLPLSPLLLLLTGCASRHHRVGDDAAHSGESRAAYASYEHATRIRPGSASAQQRLREARDEVIDLLDDHLDRARGAQR